MGQQESFHSACLMGAWIIDMTDLDAAHAAIALCKVEMSANLEVRHTLWGVQVRTDSGTAAGFLADHYAPNAIALAA
jgi:hypothetical protein